MSNPAASHRQVSPGFDSDASGTSEAVWSAAVDAQALADVHLDGLSTLVVLAAHPDDETLGAAGLVHLAHRHGVHITVVVATDGEASHPRSPTIGPHALAGLRRAEVAEAVALLAPDADVRHLGLPDGGLTDHEDALVEMLTDLVGQLTAGADPSTTLLCAPWHGDRHPDHEACGRAAAVAAARTDVPYLEYPIWLWHWGAPSDVPWRQVRRLGLDAAAVCAKSEALAAHRSQIHALSDRPGDEQMLDEDTLSHFRRDYELFVDVGRPHPSDTFEDLHAKTQDPWDVDGDYERRKRAVTLAMLPRDGFASGLEIGCSVGALSADLADRCTRLLALDASESAVERARVRLADRDHVLVQRRLLPDDWPAGTFDLIVLSEVGYFLSPSQLDALVGLMAGALGPDGVLVACHWRHRVRGWALDGPTVHRTVESGLSRHGLARLARYEEQDYEVLLFGRELSVLPPPEAVR